MRTSADQPDPAVGRLNPRAGRTADPISRSVDPRRKGAGRKPVFLRPNGLWFVLNGEVNRHPELASNEGSALIRLQGCLIGADPSCEL